jgi:hypothetical protein
MINSRRNDRFLNFSKMNNQSSKMHKLHGIDVSTSKGVKGHLPFLLLASGLITRPGLRNFPLQLLSRAFSMAMFSLGPPSYVQHEKATIS